MAADSVHVGRRRLLGRCGIAVDIEMNEAAYRGHLQRSEMLKYYGGRLENGTRIFAVRQKEIETDRKGQRGQRA
jgi:hypothetical protein